MLDEVELSGEELRAYSKESGLIHVLDRDKHRIGLWHWGRTMLRFR